jgi:hypothetical protein
MHIEAAEVVLAHLNRKLHQEKLSGKNDLF